MKMADRLCSISNSSAGGQSKADLTWEYRW